MDRYVRTWSAVTEKKRGRAVSLEYLEDGRHILFRRKHRFPRRSAARRVSGHSRRFRNRLPAPTSRATCDARCTCVGICGGPSCKSFTVCNETTESRRKILRRDLIADMALPPSLAHPPFSILLSLFLSRERASERKSPIIHRHYDSPSILRAGYYTMCV